QQASDIGSILQILQQMLVGKVAPEQYDFVVEQALQVLEVLVAEGWVQASLDDNLPRLNISSPREGKLIRNHENDWISEPLAH
nr:hypothetical protein [Gemmatales bacterium]